MRLAEGPVTAVVADRADRMIEMLNDPDATKSQRVMTAILSDEEDRPSPR